MNSPSIEVFFEGVAKNFETTIFLAESGGAGQSVCQHGNIPPAANQENRRSSLGCYRRFLPCTLFYNHWLCMTGCKDEQVIHRVN